MRGELVNRRRSIVCAATVLVAVGAAVAHARMNDPAQVVSGADERYFDAGGNGEVLMYETDGPIGPLSP
jgi:hypothetical protein